MTIKTTSIKLIYKGEVIKSRSTTDNKPVFIIKQWSKLYPKHLFDQCTIETAEGKQYSYASKFNKYNYLRRDETGMVLNPNDDNVAMCSVFGCREILILEEQLCGSKCNSCSGNEFGTIKGQSPDYEVKIQLKPQTHVKEELNTSDSKIKGKRYGAIGFGQRAVKGAMFPKPKTYW